MKKYQKAQMIAKNLPTGSYAAGCPEQAMASETCFFSKYSRVCKQCERAN